MRVLEARLSQLAGLCHVITGEGVKLSFLEYSPIASEMLEVRSGAAFGSRHTRYHSKSSAFRLFSPDRDQRDLHGEP